MLRLSIFLTAFAVFAKATVDPAMECAFCSIALGLTEEIEVQIKFITKMKDDKCGKMNKLEKAACEFAIDEGSKAVLGKIRPEATCSKINMCKDKYTTCKLFDEWPIKKLPDAPQSWPVERKLGESLSDYYADLQKFLQEISTKISAVTSASSSTASTDGNKFYDFMAQLGAMQYALKALLSGATVESLSQKDSNGCSKLDIKCKGTAVAKHDPFSDADGDLYSTKKELRGYDWRGKDCDDKNDQIYPGRATVPAGVDAATDYNCNGISGKNASMPYKELFCSGANAPRPIIALGDSATAHFHLPPQWFTAQNWNLDGFETVAADEMDFPACSWSTGHAEPDACPFQDPFPGTNGKIVSLYTQMRNRNRCNNNAYTNIGVNGARMTSSSLLVDAMKINPQTDSPVLLWLSLIGNDVCNSGHAGTPPETFYSQAIETLTRLDSMLPKGSTVVSLSLFNGELLYDTMHAQTHPIGTSYSTMYDYLNCLEVSPCFGWLNSNADIRKETTAWANTLNDQYRKIAAQSKALFKNFDYIFYDADYVRLFGDYVKAGYPGTNLIEKVDGFHPSQAGNAMFALGFWEFLETQHPEAIGAVNPHNAEMDAMFFAGKV